MQCRVLADGGAERDLSVPETSRLCAGLSINATLIVADGRLLDIRFQPGQATQQRSEVEAVTAAAGWDHQLAVKPDGTVVGRGWNSCGQACGPGADFVEPWRLTFPVGLQPKVIAVAAGEKHSLLLTESGEVFAWGSNADGQLGLGEERHSASQPCRVPIPIAGTSTGGSRTIASGARHSCALTQGDCSTLLCWGWSLHGQCGRSEPSLWHPQPVAALQGLGICQVAAGLAHTLALSTAGDVYRSILARRFFNSPSCIAGISSWGWNGDGQLGLGDTENRSEPELVDCLGQPGTAAVKVSCGARHSAVLTACGRAYGCGCTKHGELGSAVVEEDVLAFRQLPGSEARQVADVGCGWWHTALLLRTAACAKPG